MTTDLRAQFESNKASQRHGTHAELVYWHDQWRSLAERAVAALDAQAGGDAGLLTVIDLLRTDRHGKKYDYVQSHSGSMVNVSQFFAGPVNAQAGGWRTVAEATPEVGQLVAVHSPGAMICDVWPARYTRFGNFDAGGGWFEQDEITHWMPLPAGPVEGGGG